MKPNSSPEEVKRALEKLRSETVIPENKNLVRHFGKLKRGLDGMEYQKAVRNEWD